MSSRRRLVAVCGESDPQTSLADLAYELGRGMAQRDAVLVGGGLAGVMDLAARGAQAAGGLTIGIQTGRLERDGRSEPELPVAASPNRDSTGCLPG